MNFADSKPVQDFLKEGKLPTVNTSIEMDNASLIKFGVTLFIMGVVLITINKVVQKL